MWSRDILLSILSPEKGFSPLTEASSLPMNGGVSINTRSLSPGDVFFALRGDTHDGHDYVRDALSKRASFIVVDHVIEGISESQQIVVTDTKKALLDLAHYCRVKTQACVIGITGSSGKTTTKDWIAHILKNVGPTVYAKESFNNDVGVPLSLAHLKSDTAYGVFEIGMNHPGEIEPLSVLMRPHIAVITSLSEAHIGYMGSMEAIVEEKSEIMRGLDSHHTLLIPHDTPYFQTLSDKAASFNIQNVYTFGRHADAHARLVSEEPLEDGGHRVHATVHGCDISYEIQLNGEHLVLGSLAVVLACHSAGVSLDVIQKHISSFKAPKGRGRIYSVALSQEKQEYITLVDDAYNANPSSMRMGLLTFSKMARPKKGRKIVVLGSMKELGEHSDIYHTSIGHIINSLDVDIVFTLGCEMKPLFNTLSERKQGQHFESSKDLVNHILTTVKSGDFIFVKGSKSSHVSDLVNVLTNTTSDQAEG